MEEHEIEYGHDVDQTIRWSENPNGYIVRNEDYKKPDEGIFIEGFEKKLLDTDNI